MFVMAGLSLSTLSILYNKKMMVILIAVELGVVSVLFMILSFQEKSNMILILIITSVMEVLGGVVSLLLVTMMGIEKGITSTSSIM